MATTSVTIPLCEKGSDRTLLEADYANKLIVPLNAIIGGKVAPISGMGFFAYSGGQFILDLTAADQRLRTSDALAGRIANIENDIANLKSKTNAIINALEAASISASASCENNGSISVSVTLTIPNIPSLIT